ncbi:MAG: hypothetical protein KF730_01220 [Sphingomonas sp.]|uniref:hypothetical protein n=1 Tax=Sphingomonas sp. TaxID=28214 RepID=UPI0025EE697F|nr:hypothetical protein [Sphingomonas sp.]MBX3563173.1 hypothetical protein [Sphingomonas sp.]
MSTMPSQRLVPTVLIGWGVAALVLTLVSLPQIAHLWFPDPDDAMRLNEVRDWLGGQSWWDVSQHRLWGGAFEMHWSRLVDIPLAFVIAIFTPLVGPWWADRIALTGVPLVTLLIVIALGAELTRRVAGIERAKMAVLLAPLSVPLIYQLRPMRIDHHGWQIALALAAVVALLGKPNARSGALIGLSLAALLTISLEGLPITVAILGVMLLAWVFDDARREQAAAALATLVIGVVALHVATRGPAIMAPACDAIAPVWIAALAVGALGACAAMFVPRASVPARLAMLAMAGAAALAVIVTKAPLCTKGPFATLDPLSYNFWYRNVSEGLPLWDQVLPWALMTIGFPIAGLVGGVLAWREAQGEDRARLMMILALAALSFALSILIIRTGATANALALPGGAWLLHNLLTRARAITSPLKRTLATAGALIAATPGLAASALFGLQGDTQATTPVAATVPLCDQGHEIADLKALPAATLFAPLDISPALLAWTPHKAIGSGYHRNAQSIHRVLATFLGTPEAAQVSVLASNADYVVGCPGSNETEIYKSAAPNGFWARLERGERFGWLQPVAIPGSPVLIWKVIR